MKKISLYRGIAIKEINVNEVVSNIKNNGIDIVEACTWKGFYWKDLRNDLDKLLDKPNLSRHDTEPESVWVKNGRGETREYISGNRGICFADRCGANYYAFYHNINKEKNIPVVIEIETSINNIAIDGRDFLYTVFGFLKNASTSKIDRQKQIMSKIFGEKIVTYIDKAIQNPECDPYAICDLAIVDNDVIECHSKNEILIEGRCGTNFKSAFYVKTPIKPEAIKDISINNYFHEQSKYVIKLNEILY
jgi:hypothetical protein